VGKTTVACNLAVYLRALREDLPVLLLTLDDQPMPDRMFALADDRPGETIVTGMRRGNLEKTIRLGQYGVHYVPSSSHVGDLKLEIDSPSHLWQTLERTNWNGLVIIDTKSDFEALTQNAIAASDLSIVLVSDHSSLAETRRVFELMDEWGRPHRRARVLLSLVDRRVRFREGKQRDVLALLLSEIRQRGYPLFESFVSRSPAIEALYTNPDQRAYAILHHARKSLIHRQMHHLAQAVLAALDEVAPWTSAVDDDGSARPVDAPLESSAAPRPTAAARGDRRQHVRRSYAAEVPAFRRTGRPILSLRICDLSPEGLGIEPTPELANNERAQIAFPQPRGEPPLLLWARVVRSTAEGARGLAFESTARLDGNRLERLTEQGRPAESGLARGLKHSSRRRQTARQGFSRL
jgi:cellulose biosynthesis protein BcsQ